MKCYDIDDKIDNFTYNVFSGICNLFYWMFIIVGSVIIGGGGGIIGAFGVLFMWFCTAILPWACFVGFWFSCGYFASGIVCELISGVGFSGFHIALIELGLFFYASYKLRSNISAFKSIPLVPYYWYMMTILTFVWETAFIIDYDSVCDYSSDLIVHNQHVWSNRYPISTIIPWKLSRVFYAEYGAYADREYMLLRGDWSRIIEGTHAYLCGLFAIGALVFKKYKMEKEYLIMASVSMGTQLMNSILYMGNYFIQVHDKFNINYNRPNFPSGFLLSRRPFMYVNIFWTIMPIIAIYHLIISGTWVTTTNLRRGKFRNLK